MKVAILHLSDLHIEKDNFQWLLKKAEQIVPAVWNDFPANVNFRITA